MVLRSKEDLMARPRCPDCDRATKSLYEREGANASFSAIETHRLCPDCRRVLPLEETETT